jgi:hypothetical protein
MGGYRSEEEALIGLARQLTDAYGEARRREDQDYACDAIAEFLSEYRTSAPSEALLAILDLPLTAETYPLVDEAQTTLAGRGPAVVELLLEALLGEVYDPDGPASDRAAETLDLMDRRDAVQGLVEVLCGRADDDVKGAAVDGLVALGAFAEPALAGALADADGGVWARAAIDQIRLEDAQPEVFEEYAAGEGAAPDDASELRAPDANAEPAPDEHAHPARGEEPGGSPAGAGQDVADTDPPTASGADPEASFGADPQPGLGAHPPTGSGPDSGVVDDAYDDFLRRFHEDSGGEPSSS